MHSTRYTKALKTASRGYDAAATLIVLITIAWVWPNPRNVALAIVWGATGAGNVPINRWLIPRIGERRGEVVRLVYNLTIGMPMAHALGWPVPVFFWMPFAALFMNHLDKRLARGLLAIQCAVTTAAVAFDHQSLMLPLAFVVGAFVARISSEANADALLALVDESEAVTARLVAETKAREAAEVELHNAHKMEALGRLAAGVAHEINTPVQYVGDSITFARVAVRDLVEVFTRGRALAFSRGDLPPDVRETIDAAEHEADLPFLLENLPVAMDRAEEGLARIATIVRSMRTFAHPGDGAPSPLDVNEAVKNALDVAASEYRFVADVEVELDAVPAVQCRAEQINQVFLNLIVNAAHAVAAANRSSKGRIAVRTRKAERAVVVEVADTGTGIPEAIRDKIMDPFFTTKPVGKGTGQGLAIARSIVEAHGGSLAFESEVGRGTTFRVTLPIAA